MNNTSTIVWELPFGRDRRFARKQVSTAPTYRPNVTGESLYVDASRRSVDSDLNPAAVVVPTDVSQPFGNAARNAARGPALHTLDIGLHKTFALPGSRSRVEFRLEAFNVLNRSNFSGPNGNRTSTAFGTITQLSTPPRQMQLGVKFDF